MAEEMFAKLNHIAIVSENYAAVSQFYQAVFGMKTSAKPRPGRASTVGDGYVGLNINPRYAGRPAHLDHFGIEVEDAERVFARMKDFRGTKWVQRPGNRPFAAISAHDMDGNVFDISQRDSKNRTDMYTENAGIAEAEARISHFALRTLHADEVAAFYREVFELEPLEKDAGDPSHYLSDGHVTMIIRPWAIEDYLGASIIPAGMEHIGFTVKSWPEFQANYDKVTGKNPLLIPLPIGNGPEGQKRLAVIRDGCRLYRHHMTDVDGTVLSVGEA
ncbi:MAG TPA: VOC family protein [Stellaceae bacterium]|jgi:predicted enzyme related to lactoylglutathione lyase|nr:VOC family protein [Stellaceae bacterium]